jgi:hypothetical protein
MSLIASYQRTTYKLLDGDNGFMARIGETSAEVHQFLCRNNVDCLFFVCGENPKSELHSPQQNLSFTHGLMRKIIAANVMAWPAVAVPDGEWDDERGFFIHCSVDKAIELAGEYDQNAIVRVSESHPPMLIFCRSV